MMEFNIKDFGAVGDGKTLNTCAIQAAIDECAAKGGGCVVVEGGVFMSGSVTLRSNVNFYIEKDAVFLGSPDVKDYPEKENLKHVNTEMLPRWRNASLIFAEEIENISITGEGTIDCNGESFVEPDETSVLWKFKRKNLPTPPRVVFLTGCKNILIEDVKMINQPAGWSYWIHDCENVTVNKITIDADVDYPNNDGVHINSSRFVTITDCDIRCGDDCIVLRANNVSLKENKVCENVTVKNCRLTSYSAAVRIGWVQDGIIRNCELSDLDITDSSTGVSIYIPDLKRSQKNPEFRGNSDIGREATLVENISFSNLVMKRQCSYPVFIYVRESDSVMVDGIRNIRFSDIKSTGPEFPLVKGRKTAPISDITFTNCVFEITDGSEFETRSCHGWTGLESLEPHQPMQIVHTKNVFFNNTKFTEVGEV